MVFKLGILSDTHLETIDKAFATAVAAVFQDCQAIVHCGDLISLDILACFAGKQVWAVHGNTCTAATRSRLPAACSFSVGTKHFGVCHGHDAGYDLENSLLNRFPDADCIIYGHTHQPAITTIGSFLLINPGSFRTTGRHGYPGSYALLGVDGEKLSATLHTLPEPL